MAVEGKMVPKISSVLHANKSCLVILVPTCAITVGLYVVIVC